MIENQTFDEIQSDFLSLSLQEAIFIRSHSGNSTFSCKDLNISYLDQDSNSVCSILRIDDNTEKTVFCAFSSTYSNNVFDFQFLKGLKINLSRNIITTILSIIRHQSVTLTIVFRFIIKSNGLSYDENGCLIFPFVPVL